MSEPKPVRTRTTAELAAARKRWRFDLPHGMKPPQLPPPKK